MFLGGEKKLTLFCGHYCIFFNKSCSHVFNDIVVCKRKMQAKVDLAAFYRVTKQFWNNVLKNIAKLEEVRWSYIWAKRIYTVGAF